MATVHAETVIAEVRIATGGEAARGISVPALASQISEDRTTANMALVIEDVGEDQADLGRRVLVGTAISGITIVASAAIGQPGADRAVSAAQRLSAADTDLAVRQGIGDETVGAVHQIAVGLASALVVVLMVPASAASPAASAVPTDMNEAIVASVLGRGSLGSRMSADREVPDATAGGPVLMAPWDGVIRWIRADGWGPMAREV